MKPIGVIVLAVLAATPAAIQTTEAAVDVRDCGAKGDGAAD
jgi:hypothetical protein